MDVFNRRITVEEASAIVRAAQDGELLNGWSSAIFHHLGLMRARIAALQSAFPVGTLHAVAIKANPVVEILREVVRCGCGLEAASSEEVHLALAASCAREQVVYDSPAKTTGEIREALELGVYLNADNFDELARIADARKNCRTASRIGLRVNAMVGDGAIKHTSVAGTSSKFGVPLLSHQRRIVAAFADYPWLCGLHVHVGSQGCGLALLVDAAERIAELRRQILAHSGHRVNQVDIGGGLATAYRAGQCSPTPVEYRCRLEERAPDLFSSDVRLVTEFGRAIHANCGIAASRVEYVKPSQQLVVTHLGADFLLRPVYRHDDWQHEFFVLDGAGKPKSGAVTPVTITGPLCFSGDIVGRDVLLPPVEVGDWLVIRDVGAYTLSMWSRHCSRRIPPVIGYDPDAAVALRVLRRGETAGDIVRFWSDPERPDRQLPHATGTAALGL